MNWTVDSRRIAERQGVGVGLSISSVVSPMRGELTVERELGRGSTFTLTLPHATAEEA